MEIWNNLQLTLRFWLKMLNCECFPSLESWKNFSHLNYISVSTTLCRKNSSLILDSFNILEVWKKNHTRISFLCAQIFILNNCNSIFFSLLILYYCVPRKKPFFFGHKSFFLLFLVYFTLLVKVLAGLQTLLQAFQTTLMGKSLNIYRSTSRGDR